MDPKRLKVSDSSDSDDSDDSSWYFEQDDTLIIETFVQHILSKFNSPCQDLKDKIEQGVAEALNLCKDIAEETISPLQDFVPTSKLWKLGLTPEEIEKYEAMLKDLRNENMEQRVTIKRILDSNVSREQKQKLLHLFDTLQDLDPYSMEYIQTAENMNEILSGSEQEMSSRIMALDIDERRREVIHEKYNQLQKQPDSSETRANIEEWIEHALRTPFTKITPSNMDLSKLKSKFNEQMTGLELVLEPLLAVFNNRIKNPEANSSVIGLLGSPGVGKTNIGKVIADAWNLPFCQISLGGMIDPSILDGHHPAWVGSSPGRFVKALQTMGVINGVIFLDEIDKLGTTQQGLQVQYSLLHAIDPIQNNEYIDHYLGHKLPVDLSKILFICALNTTEGLDPALLNRINIINVPDYTPAQKTTIMLKHLFPQALKNAGLSQDDIILPKEACKVIRDRVEQNNGKEGGVRGVKTCINTIVDKLSLLMNEESKQLELSFQIDVTKLPIVITTDIVDKLYKPQKKFWASSIYI